MTFATNSSGTISAGGQLTMTLNGNVTGCPIPATPATPFTLIFTGCLVDVACGP